MRILVTGGAGFVGTNLIKRLLTDGHEVISVDNYSTGFRENHQDDCNYYDIDLSDSSWWSLSKTCYCQITCDCKIEPVDLIFHMAALARIQPSIKNPTTSIQNNFDSTLNVLEWARSNDIPVVFAGSSSYHHGLWGSPYAWSKFAGEQLCELYNKVYGLPTVTCRFYNVYGPHQLESGAYATVLGIFEKQFREGKALTVTGDGEQRRDFTHIDDIVDGLVKCADGIKYSRENGEDAGHITGQIFELGRGKNYSIIELTEMFGQTEVEYIPARPGEYDVTLADYSYAKDVLRWKPIRNLEDYINKVVSE